MEAFADVVRAGKALYIGVSEWTPDQLRAGHALARELHVPLRLQPAAVQRALPDHRGRGGARPAVSSGISQVVFSPIDQGILTGKYKPGEPPPEGSRATDEAGGGANSSRVG